MWGGKPAALAGAEIKAGDKAPDCILVGTDMLPRKLSEFTGKVRILSSVPSLETSVCDTETRRFNEIAAGFGDDVEIVTISMDLPFTQKRWCGAAGIDKVTVLSDHKEASFGINYGVLIKDLRLLARCVFVVDAGALRLCG
jgi:thiol peroxidase